MAAVVTLVAADSRGPQRAKLLVLVENPAGAGPWWARHELGEADDDDVSPGGTFSPGSLVALDLNEHRRLRIDVELETGWFPRGDGDRGLGTPTVPVLR